MKKNILIIAGVVIICALCLWLSACMYSCIIYSRIKEAESRTERATVLSEPMNEKEAALWAEVYTAAVRRGVWYPAREANAAVYELRKMGGVQE